MLPLTVHIKLVDRDVLDQAVPAHDQAQTGHQDGGGGAHWALELNYVPLQGIYQVFGYGYPNIVLHGKMSQRMTNKHL